MAVRESETDDIVIEHPNRQTAAAKATRLVVVLLLLASAILLVVLSVGGWDRLAGAKGFQVFFIVLYVTFAFLVVRWSRGVLPVAAAFAIILFIFAAVSAPGWYDRADDGFADTTLGAELMGLLCVVLAIVQVVLIVAAMRGFRQAWNVEVERSRAEYEARGGGPRGPGRPYAAPA